MCVTGLPRREAGTRWKRLARCRKHTIERGRAGLGTRSGQRPEGLRYVAPCEVVSRSRQSWEAGAHSDAVNLRRHSPARSRTSPRLRHTARACCHRISGAGDEWKVGHRVSRGDTIWSSTTPLRHMAQLDGLRAFAVALVLCYHFYRPARQYVPLGGIGVRVFFVLSGFLITGILLRSRALRDSGQAPAGLALRHFYIRRILRIFPLYYFALTIAWLGQGVRRAGGHRLARGLSLQRALLSGQRGTPQPMGRRRQPPLVSRGGGTVLSLVALGHPLRTSPVAARNRAWRRRRRPDLPVRRLRRHRQRHHAGSAPRLHRLPGARRVPGHDGTA